METIDNTTRPEIWTCTDGSTIRAGDKRLAIWWTVETMDQAHAIVNMMSRFTASQCIAMFRDGMFTIEQIAGACVTAEIPDSKFESLAIALETN